MDRGIFSNISAEVILTLGIATALVPMVVKYMLSQNKVPTFTVGLPIMGNLMKYGEDPIGFIIKGSTRYGEYFTVPMLFNRIVWLRSPYLNKEYLETREDIWSFGDGMGLFLNKIVVPGYFDNLRIFVGSLSRGISRQVTLEHYSQIAEQETIKSIDEWSKIVAEGRDMELFESVSFLVHKIIVRCLMGEDFYKHHAEELFELLHIMEANVGSILHTILPTWVSHSPARALWRARDRVGEIFELRLREREKAPEQWQDSLDYISYTLQDPTTARLSHMYSAHHTLLMFAAHTSTVASISWTLLELIKSPESLNRLREDLDVAPSYDKSAWLDALVKETSRQYVGNSDVRWTRKEKTLRNVHDASNPVTIPAGTVVSISPYLTHHDPEYWRDPDIYTPQRWIENPDLAKNANLGGGLRFIPFGAGSHRCPGEKMAVMISKIVLSTVAKQCNLRWGPSGYEQKKSTLLESLDFSRAGSPWLKNDARVQIQRQSSSLVYGH